MSEDLFAIILCAVATAGLSSTGPLLIARLPEPVLESDAAEKTSYVDLAARPRLARWLAAAGALVGAVVGWSLGLDAVTAAWVYLGAIGVILAFVDSRTRLLPTRLIAPSYAILVALIAVAYAVDTETQLVVRAALGWAVYGGFYALMWLIYPSGLGYGDVRLSGLLGIALGYIGWGALLTGMYAGFLLGGVGGGLLAALKIADRKHFPFGPFMLLGSMVGLVWGQSVADWYTSF